MKNLFFSSVPTCARMTVFPLYYYLTKSMRGTKIRKLSCGQRPLEVARLSKFGLYLNNANGEVDFAQFPMERKSTPISLIDELFDFLSTIVKDRLGIFRNYKYINNVIFSKTT